MGKMRVMLPAPEVDISSVKYQPEVIKAPHLTGFVLKVLVWLVESPIIGPIILSGLKRQNKFTEMLQNTVIPESPMFRPEFPPQEKENGVVDVGEDREPVDRVALALECLTPYDSSRLNRNNDSHPFLYWTIRDYAHAYRTKLTTPSIVARHIISAVEESNKVKPPMLMLIHFDAEELLKQAAASTQRFLEGNPISILDGIFVAIKDDIDCFPYPTKGGTTWFHKVRNVKQDAVCVSRLRSCGVIFIGKTNMHELGMGTTGNNPNYGTTRNPHSVDSYTGGSSSGPAALVASGLCSAALGTDGGGSIRIPSSLCGVVGLKTTYARVDMEGSLCDCGTVEVISPLAATVEDIMLVYAAMAGSSVANRTSLNPGPLCLPNLLPSCDLDVLRSMRLGKYTEWFNDVHNTEISTKCEDALNLLSEVFDCKTVEIILPELQEMRAAHIVSIGSETMCSLNPYCEDGKLSDLTYDTRFSLALFRSFSATDYVAAQCLSITAPKIPSNSLKAGESNYEVSGFVLFIFCVVSACEKELMMENIPTACVMDWSIEIEKGLRSKQYRGETPSLDQ